MPISPKTANPQARATSGEYAGRPVNSLDKTAVRAGRSAPVYRRPSDAILLALSVLALLAIVLFFLTSRGYLPIGDALVAAVAFLPDFIEKPVRSALEYGSLGAVLIGIGLAARSRAWLLVRNIALAGLLTFALTGLIEWAIPYAGLQSFRAVNPSADVAMVAALALVAGGFVQGRWIRFTWALVLLVTVLEFLLASFSALQITGGLSLGVALGALVNFLLGVPHPDISTRAIREAFEAHGIALGSVRRIGADARGSVPYFATSDEGDYFVKLVSSEQRNADLLFKLWRTLLLKDPASTAPFITAMQQIEHEAYLGLLAQKQGVRTPDVEFTARVAQDTAVLATQRLKARELSDLQDKQLSDNLLREIWRQVALLHGARIYHGDLRLANILVDEHNQPWLVDFGFSAAGADDKVLAHDTAQLLASMSYAAEPERIVPIALHALGPDALVQALPNLTPLALSSATRADLRDDPDLLEQLREEIEDECGVSESQERESPFRVQKHALFWMVGLGIGVYVLLPQLGQLNKIIETWASANPLWVLLALLTSAATYAAAPLQVLGALGKHIPYLQFLIAQFAATFGSRLGPQGLGGIYVIERFVEHSGVGRREAVAAVAIGNAVSPFVHMTLTSLTLALLGIEGIPFFKGVKLWQIGLAGGVLLVLMIYLWRSDRLGSAMKTVRTSIQDLRAALKNPLKGLQLVGGALSVTLAYITTLFLCLVAVGVNIPIFQVAAVYLAGSIIGSASPTPGGLGVLEGALVAGLGVFGVSTNQAVAGVLLYRLLTFWLPILPGLFAFRYLQRTGRL